MGAFRVLSRKLINLSRHSLQNLPIPAKHLAHPFPASNFSDGIKSFSHPWQYSHCRTLILESVSSEPVRLHRLSDSDSGIVEVHLDRPEAKNAISKEMLRGLRHAFESVDCDPSVNVMMIRSTVPKVFCAGADLKERKNMTASEVQSFVTSLRSAFSFLEALRIPTISVIEGAALGGGLEMALACDLRICGEDAKLSLPETGLAIIPGGRDAVSIGLVNYCVPAGGAYVKALEIAQEINQKGPLAIKMAKKAIDEGLEVGLESAMEVEEECYKELLNTVDRLEGLAAFAEKRKP
ncbi:putative enoyl-CoA hydratase 2, mitochondrial, partial [Cucurbita argyrosperma subsp. argyrosperma]